ncbi:hypothetical protein D3C71_2171790 [compost metagenome]
MQHLLRIAHADGQLQSRMARAVGGHHLDHMERSDRADLQLPLVQLACIAQEEIGL